MLTNPCRADLCRAGLARSKHAGWHGPERHPFLLLCKRKLGLTRYYLSDFLDSVTPILVIFSFVSDGVHVERRGDVEAH